jgi:hypothetical protein
VAQQPKTGLSCSTVEISRSHEVRHTHTHTHTHTHARARAREESFNSDQLFAEAAAYTTYNKRKRRTSMSSGGFEPAITAIKRRTTHALNSTAAGLSLKICYRGYIPCTYNKITGRKFMLHGLMYMTHVSLKRLVPPVTTIFNLYQFLACYMFQLLWNAITRQLRHTMQDNANTTHWNDTFSGSWDIRFTKTEVV